MTHPYQNLPPSAYWKTAVADRGPWGVEGLWTPKYRIRKADKVVTAGSCFAQHIGRALKARGYRWTDFEPAPDMMPTARAADYGYGIFSFRTGNIYTARMLCQWLSLAYDLAEVSDEIWEKDGRFFDPLRPAIEPNGFASRDEVMAARAATVAAFRRAVEEADVFVFTLGLTESWRHRDTALEYAMCPGTIAGSFDPDVHVFANARAAQISAQLARALKEMRRRNRRLRVLLTVSPVPLTATASGEHVLTATSRSKSVLRTVAAEAAEDYSFVDYFPSYEIITHPVFGGMFYKPNMRSVDPRGVETVMSHFFADQTRLFGPEKSARKPAKAAAAAPEKRAEDVRCEEEMLNAFAA